MHVNYKSQKTFKNNISHQIKDLSRQLPSDHSFMGKALTTKDLTVHDCGAYNHASHAPQSLLDNFSLSDSFYLHMKLINT